MIPQEIFETLIDMIMGEKSKCVDVEDEKDNVEKEVEKDATEVDTGKYGQIIWFIMKEEKEEVPPLLSPLQNKLQHKLQLLLQPKDKIMCK